MYGFYGTLGVLMVLISFVCVYRRTIKKRGNHHEGELASNESVIEVPGIELVLNKESSDITLNNMPEER